jgi:hypothetical protein
MANDWEKGHTNRSLTDAKKLIYLFIKKLIFRNITKNAVTMANIVLRHSLPWASLRTIQLLPAAHKTSASCDQVLECVDRQYSVGYFQCYFTDF